MSKTVPVENIQAKKEMDAINHKANNKTSNVLKKYCI